MERPRKLGAKWTGEDIQPDEVDQSAEVSWIGKRDRWNGYDPAEHHDIIKEYELVEEARKNLKATELDREAASGDSAAAAKIAAKVVGAEAAHELGIESDEEADEERYAEGSDMPGQKVDTKSRTTIRNLR